MGIRLGGKPNEPGWWPILLLLLVALAMIILVVHA